MTNVAALKPAAPNTAKPTPAKQQPQSHRGMIRKLRRQGIAAIGVGLVAGTLTALSLKHLATGINLITGAPTWEAWAMATGIDLGFVALELAQLAAATEKLRRDIGKWTKPAIVGTLTGSAVMNAFAFASGVSGEGWIANVMIGAAVAFGIVIPALIYALTRIGATMYIDCHSRA